VVVSLVENQDHFSIGTHRVPVISKSRVAMKAIKAMEAMLLYMLLQPELVIVRVRGATLTISTYRRILNIPQTEGQSVS
jgi:hypothetical protein